MIENFEKATVFTRSLFNILDEKILEIEKEALDNKIPIITREVLNYMLFLAKNIKARDILEIGSAVGYSSIFLSQIAKENGGKLTTIEIDKLRYEKAKENFKKVKLEDFIDIHLGDALEILPNITKKFDYIFIDASKSKYEDFFKYSYDLLNEGGYIFIDNIMFRGYVSENEVDKKYKTIIRNLKNFITKLNENYNFVLLPFGDGVGIIKK